MKLQYHHKPTNTSHTHPMKNIINHTCWRRYRRTTHTHTHTLPLPQVIQGWDEGILGMSLGEKSRLKIPAMMAYGAKGTGTEPYSTGT